MESTCPSLTNAGPSSVKCLRILAARSSIVPRLTYTLAPTSDSRVTTSRNRYITLSGLREKYSSNAAGS